MNCVEIDGNIYFKHASVISGLNITITVVRV